MTALAYDGDRLCDGADCASAWRVALQDGSRWCRLHAADAARALRARMEREQYQRGCTLCGSEVARPYPAGWRCDLHSPAAMRAVSS